MPFVKKGEAPPVAFALDRVSPVTQARSTFVTSSRGLLREQGLFARYVDHLARADRHTLESLVPGLWVPIDLLHRHYLACDAVGMTSEEKLRMGKGIFRRVHEPVFAVGLRLAGAMGANPWTLAKQSLRMWPRAFVGGGIFIAELGPKEGRFEVLGLPFSELSYVKLGWRGILTGAVELFSQRVYVSELTRLCTPTRMAYRVSWV
jgi:hypothetical protein